MAPRLVVKFEDFDCVEVGDVIYWGPRRRPRKVRAVSRSEKDHSVQFIYFAILQRSWTNAPHTCYHRGDIKRNFHGFAIFNSPVCSGDRVECLVQKEIDTRGSVGHGRPRFISAQEMAGTVL